eukprot:483756-Pleurochrysis_carterae.AAC.2
MECHQEAVYNLAGISCEDSHQKETDVDEAPGEAFAIDARIEHNLAYHIIAYSHAASIRRLQYTGRQLSSCAVDVAALGLALAEPSKT